MFNFILHKMLVFKDKLKHCKILIEFTLLTFLGKCYFLYTYGLTLYFLFKCSFLYSATSISGVLIMYQALKTQMQKIDMVPTLI